MKWWLGRRPEKSDAPDTPPAPTVVKPKAYSLGEVFTPSQPANKAFVTRETQEGLLHG